MGFRCSLIWCSKGVTRLHLYFLLDVAVLRLYLGSSDRFSLIFLMTPDQWFLPNLGDFHSVFGPNWILYLFLNDLVWVLFVVLATFHPIPSSAFCFLSCHSQWSTTRKLGSGPSQQEWLCTEVTLGRDIVDIMWSALEDYLIIFWLFENRGPMYM